MRVFIHNSDSPRNRGDRAILVGNIELVRRLWPDAEIWSLSQYRERDERWFDINFLPQSPYSVNPLKWLAMLRLARKSDLVLWGGGEILKDYTNIIGLVYWFIKVASIRVVNRNLVGAFQGIGPTKARISKALIRATVNRTRAFITRDEESRAKLVSWGVRVPVVASFDPAVVGVPSTFDSDVAARLQDVAGIDKEFLRNAAGFGLRKWFFYRQGGWLPHKFTQRTSAEHDAEPVNLTTYRVRIAALADGLIERHNINLVFFPMHMDDSEGDAAFASSVIDLMEHGDRTRVLAGDVFSPREFVGIIAELRFFVASRLHSAILATTARVPSIVLYYVDKGRLYFEQLGLNRYGIPIEAILDDGSVARLTTMIDELLQEQDVVRETMSSEIENMADSALRDLRSVVFPDEVS